MSLRWAAANTCPTEAADDNNDGRVSTTEGQPFYGAIQVSLTTEGDFSPDSALAVDRMPIADSDGDVSYHHTVDVSDDVAADLRAGKAVRPARRGLQRQRRI